MHISPVLWQFLVKWLHASALFPAEASTIAPYMDALYFFLLLITVVGMALVGALVVGFSLRYRRERNPVATQVEGSTLLEATWTIIPLALFLVCFVWGALLYFLSGLVRWMLFPSSVEIAPGRITVVRMFFAATSCLSTSVIAPTAHFDPQ